MLDTNLFTELEVESPEDDSQKGKVCLQRMLSFAAHAVKADALKAQLQTAAGEQATVDLVAT